MARGWLKRRAQIDLPEETIVLVLGVHAIGDLRQYDLLATFPYSSYHIHQDSPLLVSPKDVTNYDYVLVVREEVARRNGWLK